MAVDEAVGAAIPGPAVHKKLKLLGLRLVQLPNRVFGLLGEVPIIAVVPQVEPPPIA